MGNPNLQNNISFSSEWFLLCYILFREAKFILLCGWQFKGECRSILLLTNVEYFKCSQFLSRVLMDERWSHVSRVTLRCTCGSKSSQDEEVRDFCCLWFCRDVAKDSRSLCPVFNLGKWCVKRSSQSPTFINRLQTVCSWDSGVMQYTGWRQFFVFFTVNKYIWYLDTGRAFLDS